MIDDMLSNKVNLNEALRVDKENECIYIYIPVAYPLIRRYLRDYNLEENVLGKNDFVKQLKGSKYLVVDKTMPARINGAVKKCYKLDLNLFEELKLDNICLFEPVSEENFEQIPFA